MMAGWEEEVEIDDTPRKMSRGERKEEEMDITPMIDITFLLLIFFLVASNPDNSNAADLANAKNGRGVPQQNSTIITIGDTGSDKASVYLNDGTDKGEVSGTDEQQQTAIQEYVEKEMNSNSKHTGYVIIKADRSVKFRETHRVIQAISKVERSRIALAVRESD